MAKNRWQKIIFSPLGALFLIIFLGFVLRFWRLDSYPVELNSQEALLGWRAKSILWTGKDETGRDLPLIFSTVGGYQLPLATYLTVPFVAVLGLTPMATRLPFVLAGTLAIIALYGIVRFILPKDKNVALWSAFFLAVNPWTVYLSRNCSAANLSFSLFLLGVYFLFLGWQKKNFLRWLGVVFLIMALFTAKIAWFFILPFLIFSWIFLFKREKKILRDLLVVFLVFLPLLFSYVKAPQAKIDFLTYDLSLFSEPSIPTSINLMRGESLKAGFPLMGRIFYNKLFYLEKLISNFLVHFNPRFYFSSGDGNPFHGLTNFGPILFIFLPVTLAGIWVMFKKKKDIFIFLAVWFCLGIIPSVLVLPSPDQEKTIFVLPVLAIIASFGLARMKRSFLVIFLTILTFNFSFVSYDALIKEPRRFQEERQVGYRNLSLYLKENFEKYEKIYLTDAYGADPGPALLFYLDYPAKQFQKEQKQTLVYRNWINQVDKILINRKDLWTSGEARIFILARGEEELTGAKETHTEIKTINDLNGQPIFSIFRY